MYLILLMIKIVTSLQASGSYDIYLEYVPVLPAYAVKNAGLKG
jgi:hypothetical protein